MTPATASDIVDFWLGDSAEGPDRAERRREVWYVGGPELDATIVARFQDAVEEAIGGGLLEWESTPVGALALVILLDQFTRNVYRGTIEAYSGDARAYAVMHDAMASGLDRSLSITGRLFLYHPLHHSESLADQNRVVAILREMRSENADQWHDWFDRRVAGFTRHRDIVARFGRFPHRNRVLGREDTAPERAYIDGGGESFGQGSAR